MLIHDLNWKSGKIWNWYWLWFADKLRKDALEVENWTENIWFKSEKGLH